MTFKEYEEQALSTAIYPGKGTSLGVMYVSLKMNGEAGEFAEHVGKAIRDDGYGVNELTSERRELLIKEIGDVLWYLNAAAVELGTSLEQVAETNVAKLAKRKQENKIKGSGDNR